MRCAKAAYKTTSTFGLTATNSLGVGRVVFRIGRATLGFSVKVTVLVVKGHQAGVCVASFTPTRAVAVPKPKPVPKPIPQPVPHPVPPPRPAGLEATISPVWIGHSIGDTLPAPSPGACRSPHPGYGGECGTLRIDAVVSGFSAYGGVPAVCAPRSTASLIHPVPI